MTTENNVPAPSSDVEGTVSAPADPAPAQPVGVPDVLPVSGVPAADPANAASPAAPAVPPPAGNAMAPAEHSSDPQPVDSHTPYTDVDPQPLVPKLRWESPAAMVKEIDNHVRQSHGLAADTSLLKEIAAFVRQVSHIEDES